MNPITDGIDIGFNQPMTTVKRVMHRLPLNPMDRSTIVSAFPREIHEFKPTIFPGDFRIPAAVKGDFNLFIVEPSSYYLKASNERMPPNEVQINSVVLANSIVQDYLVGTRRNKIGIQGPAVFFVPGEYDKINILDYVDRQTKQNFQTILNLALERQKKWMVEIVDEADEFWARSNGNPRSIPDEARTAADYLGITNKEWQKNVVAAQLSNCPYCGEMINLIYPICKFCHHVVNKVKNDALDLHFLAAEK